MMGDHKAADRSKLPPPVVKALLAMQPGQVSDIIEFDANDYTILRLNAHHSCRPAEIRNRQGRAARPTDERKERATSFRSRHEAEQDTPRSRRRKTINHQATKTPRAQVLTSRILSAHRLGPWVNFDSTLIRQGIQRIAL